MPPSSPQESDKSSREFVKQSSLYQEFLAEREEILRHKWLESERLGHDIGFERALLDWIRKHRESWRTARRSQSSTATSGTPTGKQSSGQPLKIATVSTKR
ncbi:MAG: hypothetical protein K0R17_3259 [Rariglobus sp.]|nr:hypothetical protein [Rariglobus sp.]